VNPTSHIRCIIIFIQVGHLLLASRVCWYLLFIYTLSNVCIGVVVVVNVDEIMKQILLLNQASCLLACLGFCLKVFENLKFRNVKTQASKQNCKILKNDQFRLNKVSNV